MTTPNPLTNTISGHRGLQLEEPLIFEMDVPGRSGVDLPDVPKHKERLGGMKRKGQVGLPGLAESQVVRHYTKLSQKNYAIDMSVYPLGSCTIKHNPRACNSLAMLSRFANRHPLAPDVFSQGYMACIYELQQMLAEVTGMPGGVSLTPMAGAQGEFAGIAM